MDKPCAPACDRNREPILAVLRDHFADDLQLILARFDTQTAIPDAQPRELLISANTRESRIASYLSIWKRKVEAVGTRHFPFETRDFSDDRSPVLEVAVNAYGGLGEVVVRTSSCNGWSRVSVSRVIKASDPDAHADGHALIKRC